MADGRPPRPPGPRILPPDHPWALPDAAAKADPAFARLHDFWLARTAGDRLPARAGFQPTDLPADLLPFIALIAVEGHAAGARRYLIRLQGSALHAVTGRNETGRYYDEVTEPAGYAVIARLLDEAVDRRRPVFLAAPSATLQRSFLGFGRLGLPLAADGWAVDMILALVRPLDLTPA